MDSILSFILCLFLATYKEAFLLCFSALVLQLAVFVVTNIETNIIFEVERFLSRREFQKLVIPIRVLSKALTPAKEKEKQLDCIRSWNENLRKEDEVIQRETYLLDEKELLEEKGSHGGDLKPEEKASLTSIKKELGSIKPRLWKVGQTLSQVHSQWVYGSWTLEDSTKSAEKQWNEDAVICLMTFGCCARGCGCCRKPRLGRGGRRGELDVQVPTHCTVACGCCVRWRGFQYPQDLKPGNEGQSLGQP